MDKSSSQEEGSRPVRRVRCPRCHSILQEPGAPVYQCGGCGTTLRAKNRAGGCTPPPRSGHHLDVASTSRSSTPTPPDVRSSSTWRRGTDATGARHDVASTSSAPAVATTAGGRRQQGSDATGRREPRDRVSARNRVSEQVAMIEKRVVVHDDSTPAAANQEETREGSEGGGPREAAGGAPSPGARAVVRFSRGGRKDEEAASEPSLQDSAPPAGQNLGPLRKKILQTVDELKGDLSQLFSKSPDLNAPKQEAGGAASHHAAMASRATGGHRGSAARAAKHAHVVAAPRPPRGLPSRRYRQCRADPCRHTLHQPRSSCRHHGCCCGHHGHGKPECSSCRGYCCRPRAQQDPSAAPRKPPPRNHCRPVLKGAPFIVCSSCFKLVQVPADFAVAATNKTVRKLRCGACSTVLSYSYRDPARKKAYEYQDSVDGSEQGFSHPADPFAPFVDGFGLSSYSTGDEQPLHVSRNTSFDTVDGGAKGVGRLHRLMGYGSASELLRHSPDGLYQSFSERTTPDVMMGQYDRKGKSVWIDDDGDDGYDVHDSDDEDAGALKRSAARGGPGWQLPWMIGKGTPAPGAIRIK